jgi:hypothetical protein
MKGKKGKKASGRRRPSLRRRAVIQLRATRAAS